MTYNKIYMTFNIKRHMHARVIFRCGIRPWEWAKVTEENKTSLTLACDPPADWHLRNKTIIAWRHHAIPYCAAFAIYVQEALGQ